MAPTSSLLLQAHGLKQQVLHLISKAPATALMAGLLMLLPACASTSLGAPQTQMLPQIPPGVAVLSPSEQTMPADEILALIAERLPGIYDNSQQRSASPAAATDSFQLTTIIRAVNVPSLESPTLGGALYYVEEYKDADPNPSYS